MPRPLPGQTVVLDIFSSEVLLSPPTVLMGGLRYATLSVQFGVRSYRFTYVVSPLDTGTITVSGTSSVGDVGVSIISDVFEVAYAGDPGVPFGMYPFGYSGFGLSYILPIVPPVLGPDELPPPPDEPPAEFPVETLQALYRWTLRRGQEGPQVVASWLNPGGLQVRLLRKELDFPSAFDDADAKLMLNSAAALNFSDVFVVDNTVYYYSLFFQRLDGSWARIANGGILVIDNQAVVDWMRLEPVLSQSVTAQPGAPATGDRYIVPAGAAGVDWLGQDGKIAEWNGLAWVFTTPLPRMFVTVADEGLAVVYRLTEWVTAIDKERISLYGLLEDYDRARDKETQTDAWAYEASAGLDGEQFNFDTDSAKGRYTLERVLKNFDLPHGEVKGLVDYVHEFYQTQTVKLDQLLHVAALIGYDDFTLLENPTRRFLVGQMAEAHYPRVGSREAVALAIPMWVGTDVTVVRQDLRPNVFIANRSRTPVVTPTPDDTRDTVDDGLSKTISVKWATLRHYRSLGLWFDAPFDPTTYSVPIPVLSVVTDQPGAPADGDAYIVPVGAAGIIWAGEDGKLAVWDDIMGMWFFTPPAERRAVLAADDGSTYVYRGVFPNGSWDKAIPVEAMLRLEWWLRSYALPDTVYFRFLETGLDGLGGGSPLPLPLIDGFEEWIP